MKMRIIAGKYGGRFITAPKAFKSQPMSERIRGAIFNSLGDIAGKTVLDAFGGSGAMAIEAASRYAKSVVVIERDRSAQQVISANITAIGDSTIRLIGAAAGSWSTTNPSAQFDIVLCDPPYNDPQWATVTKISRHVSTSGILVLSHASSLEPPSLPGLHLDKTKQYGNATISYYTAGVQRQTVVK